ncbi:MAG TPA: aminotransferase [Aestuariivirgaceae bacterium]|jgi:aspartate/methionine/tyrosine aminotransferase
MSVNPLLGAIEAPPIAEAATWVSSTPRNRELINLCQAVPSYPPSPLLQDHLAEAVKQPGTGLYTDIAGLSELRRTLAASIAEDYRGDIGEFEVLISAGCNQAYCLVMLALAGNGDNVILPAPYYFNHQMWLAMLGIEVRCISAFNGAGTIPDAREAAAQIDDRTRAIVLVSPNNPTGAIFPSDAIAEFFELAKQKSIALVLDETYKDFRLRPEPPHGLFQRADWRDTFVQLYSFSKSYALAGYRVGSVIAGQALIAEIEKIMDCISISAARISQYGALFALQSLDSWKREKHRLMAERLHSLRTAFDRPRLKYELVSSGAYFAYVRHPFENMTAKAVAQRLAKEHDILCLPGSMFGPGQERYLRLAFANVEAQVMSEVVDRLEECQ